MSPEDVTSMDPAGLLRFVLVEFFGDEPGGFQPLAQADAEQINRIRNEAKGLVERAAGVTDRILLPPTASESFNIDAANPLMLARLSTRASTALSADEKWLAEVPVAMARLPNVNAQVFRNGAGSHAIVLHFGLFSSLFMMNRLRVEMEMAARTRQGDVNALIEEFLHLMGWLLEETEMKRRRPYQDPAVAAWTHAVGEIQRVFLLLHEWGHVALGHLEHARSMRPGLSNYSGAAQADEFEADEWAARRLTMVDFGDAGKSSLAVLATFFLFEYAHLLDRLNRWYSDDDHPPPRSRFDRAQGIIDPEHSQIPVHVVRNGRENTDLLYAAYQAVGFRRRRT